MMLVRKDSAPHCSPAAVLPVPFSKHGFNATQFQRGFTLIEILVVMFIIAISVTFAAMSLGSGTRPYEIKSASKRFYGVANLAVEEAILTGKQLGLRFDYDLTGPDIAPEVFRYEWLVYDDEEKQWLPYDESEVFAAENFPEAVRLEVEIEKSRLVIGGEKEGKDKSWFTGLAPDEEEKKRDDKGNEIKKIVPDIYFLSSGEVNEFEVKLADQPEDSPVYRVVGDIVGRITFLMPGEEKPYAETDYNIQ